MNRFIRFLSVPAAIAVGFSIAESPTASARARPIRGLASVRETPAEPLDFPLPTGPTSIAHSHNDFAQAHPLETALENGYSSVEVDVTDRGGEVSVVHLGLWTFGTLKDMYLDRLQRLVDEKGSVYGDGKEFTLWIEIRPWITGEAIVPFLKKLLDSYPMFAVFGKSGKILRPGAVEAVVINDHAREYFANRKTAPACLGTNGVDPSTAPNEPFECWNYVHWSRYFDWNGEGEIPAAELSRLKRFQSVAHARGVKTRYWGVPDTPEFWRRIRSYSFLDLVGSDHLKMAMDILRSAITPIP